MNYEPLFDDLRSMHGPDATLVEEVPDWLIESLTKWVLARVDDDSRFGGREKALQVLERMLRRRLNWSPHGEISAYYSLRDTIASHRRYGLEAANLLVRAYSRESSAVHELEAILATAGSAWTVDSAGERPRLVRRIEAEVAARSEDVVASSGRAGEHLARAFTDIYGMDPDPSDGYREAVKAVEAAGVPVISPDNDRATLGTMIRDFGAKPEKWDVPLGATPEQGREVLLGMMQGVWHGQHDRHGVADDAQPIEVSPAEAEAALHTATTLVHLFSSGLVRRASE